MMAVRLVLCCFIVLLGLLCLTHAKSLNETQAEAEKPIGAGYKQKWGYVDVRPRAHMFWWLYYTSHSAGYLDRPLVLWLQGGPGAGSTGYGNFDIMGPENVNQEPRDSTWLKEASVIYVDNPVGAGFSYVDSDDAFTTDVDEVAVDLLTLYKEFLRSNPDFRRVPLYIFGQSYGGKMAAAFAKRLHEDIRAGNVEANLAGFAMGNAWISPVDATMTWGPLLFWMSIVDEPGLDAIQMQARACKKAADEGRWQDSTNLWRATQRVVGVRSNYIDFYNILNYRVFTKAQLDNLNSDEHWMDDLVNPVSPYAPDIGNFMNTRVRKHLGIIPENVSWGAQAGGVFKKQEIDFMKPVVNTVDEMLKTTDMKVIVYQGQLDLICDTKGAMDWVQQMTWSGLGDYNKAERLALVDPTTKQTDTYVKAHKNFKFYWNLKAGHAVPRDNFASVRMLRRVIDDVDN